MYNVCGLHIEMGGSGRRRSRRLNTLQVKQLQDGEEIHTALSNAPDPVAFQVCVCVCAWCVSCMHVLSCVCSHVHVYDCVPVK